MVESRRTRAIRLLRQQYTKADTIKIFTFGKWKARTDAIVKQYIGDTDFHRQKFETNSSTLDLSKIPKSTDSQSKKDNWLKAQKHLAKEYIYSCIQYLENDGQMAQRPNILMRFNNEVIYAIYIGSVVSAFLVGWWWADAPINPLNYHKSENKGELPQPQSIPIAPVNSPKLDSNDTPNEKREKDTKGN